MRLALAGGVVAILRGRRAEHLDAVLGVLVEAGIRSLEITLSTPGALAAIRRAGETFGPDVTVGAGTVRTVADADAAVGAGAAYLVSPHTDPALAARVRQLGAAYLRGAFTPPSSQCTRSRATPYSRCRMPRIHTAAVWRNSGTPTRLPSRSFGVRMPESVFTKMKPWRNMREGKMGSATKGKSPSERRVI